jgi:hypothetical protein
MTTRTANRSTFHPITILALVFVAFFTYGFPAQAFTGKDKIPVLKTEVHTSKADFEAATTLISDAPDDDASLAFHIRLPKGWLKRDVSVDKGASDTDIFTQIAAYTTPPRMDHPSIFRVRSIPISQLIRADDWFIGYMLDMGFSIEGMTVKSPTKIMAQYTLFEEGDPYVTRATITISGNKVILAEYLVHQENYGREQDQQIWAMTGFDMPTPSMKPPVLMKTFSFIDIAKFDYPENWAIYSQGISDIKRMNSTIISTVDAKGEKKQAEIPMQIAGRIDISVISKSLGTTLPDEIKALNGELTKNQYKLGKYIGTISDIQLDPHIKASRIDSYQMESEAQKLAGYEYWVAILQSDSRYYLVRLITIGRGENFVVWAGNTETYRTILRSLSPASSRIDY